MTSTPCPSQRSIFCITFCFECSFLKSSSTCPPPEIQSPSHQILMQKSICDRKNHIYICKPVLSPDFSSGSPADRPELATPPAETLGKAPRGRSALQGGWLPAHHRLVPPLKATWGCPSHSSFPWSDLPSRTKRSLTSEIRWKQEERTWKTLCTINITHHKDNVNSFCIKKYVYNWMRFTPRLKDESYL